MERNGVIMTNRLDLDGYLVQRGIEELPRVVRDIVGRIMGDYETGRTGGKVPDDFGGFTEGEINLIPSKHKGRCHSLLVGICYDGDNFEERIRTCLDHAAIQCRGINEEVFIISTQWNSFSINKFKGYIESLRGNGLSINMIYVTERSFVLMPV